MNCYPKGITSKYCIVYDVKVDEHDIYCCAFCPAGFPWEWTKWRRAVRNAKKTNRKIACEFICEDTGNRILVEVQPNLGRGITIQTRLNGGQDEPHIIAKNRRTT